MGPHLQVVSGETEEAKGRALCLPGPACNPGTAVPLMQIRIPQLLSATSNALRLVGLGSSGFLA